MTNINSGLGFNVFAFQSAILFLGGIFGRVLIPQNVWLWFDVFALQVSGLGKLSPNSVMVGFKQDWKEDPVKDHHGFVFIFRKNFQAGLSDYLQVMFSAFELELSFAILRCQDGLDLSDHFAPEKELGNEEKLRDPENGEKVKKDDEEEEEGHNENKVEEEGGSTKSKPSIWMISTQVVP